MDITRVIPGRVRRKALSFSYQVKSRVDLVRLGSDYGGWIIPEGYIGTKSVCYCAGVGQDVTFDLALIERYGCAIHAFDPTPEAKEHVESLPTIPEDFHLHEYGLWSSDDTLKFYSPRNPEADISHSALNLGGTDTYFEAPVKSLHSIMASLNHTSIDLLKMDIEGAEHTVLQHMRERSIWPKILCVEFDQPCSLSKIRSQIRMLESHNYSIVATDRWNFTFIRE